MAFLIVCTVTLSASSKTDSVSVFFPVSRMEIVPAYMENRPHLDSFDARLDSLRNRAVGKAPYRIDLFGAASPEGSYAFNRMLSRRRADILLDYLTRLINVPDSLVERSYAVRNWQTLRLLLNDYPMLPARDDVKRLLDSALSDNEESLSPAQSDALLNALRRIDGGKAYSYMARNIFPKLREARLMLFFHPEMMTDSIMEDSSLPYTAALAVITPLLIPTPPQSPPGPHPHYRFAIRTNLLFDAAAVPTLGLEFPIGKRFSLQGEWMYAWWSHRASDFFWRIYGGDIGARWWFGSKTPLRVLSGHHLGIYLQALIWDFETGGRGYMGGAPPGKAIWDRANLGAGIEYGYSFPLNPHLSLDLSLGIGYLGGSWREYLPMCGNYVWQSTHTLSYFGPTKGEVSLVYLF